MYRSTSSSSSILPRLATTLIFLLILIPSLKILINGFNSLSTLVLGLFFKAPPCVLVSFLKGLRLSAEGFLSAFQSLAEALKAILVGLIEMVLGILGSFLMGVLEFVINVVFGSFAESAGSAFGGLLEKTKDSWDGSLLEQVKKVVGSVCEKVIDQVLDMATSSASSLFGFAKTGIWTILSKPGSVIGGLVETLKGSLESGSSVEGVRGIVGSLIEKVAKTGLGVASSSTFGSFEFVKSIFGLVVESGYTVGGLVEKTRAALEVLRMEELRAIVEGIAKLVVNLIFSYFLG